MRNFPSRHPRMLHIRVSVSTESSGGRSRREHWWHRRSWDEAYEQLQFERGACNLVQKYTPQLVRQRVMSTPQGALQVVVRLETARASGCSPLQKPGPIP